MVDVTVVMTTYNPSVDAPRFRYARRCIGNWRVHAHIGKDYYLRDRMRMVVTDDGSPDQVGLQELAQSMNITAWTGPHNGIGASLNRALQHVEGPWIYTTDDWLLDDYLDLELPLWLLSRGYDLVRLGPIHPELVCITKFTQGYGWWLDVMPMPNYAFATRPFLAAPTLVQKVGPFLEGVDAYECEKDYAIRVAQKIGAVSIAAINLAGPWEHIGEYEVGDRL